MLSTVMFFPVLIKLEISQQIFEKYSNKFNKNPSSGNRVVPCGGMDRHEEANRHFRSFYKVPISVGRLVLNF